jgi:hypothetical protein
LLDLRLHMTPAAEMRPVAYAGLKGRKRPPGITAGWGAE